MLKIRLLICLLILGGSATAQIGNLFPLIEGENFKNEFITIPADTKGKHTLIGLAYSKKAEDDLKTWFSPAYNTFLREPDPKNIFQIDYNINLYFIPMFTGAKRPAYKTTMEKVKKTIDNRLEPYILFYQGKLKEYEEALGFDGKEVPYIYLLDPEGKIIYTTDGKYSDRKMQEIIDQYTFRIISHFSMTKGPVGVFDSGYGGLSVLKELPELGYLSLGGMPKHPIERDPLKRFMNTHSNVKKDY